MMTTSRYQLEVFKERLVELCREVDVTLNVNGFDYEFDIYAGFDEEATQDSVDKLHRTSGKYGRLIRD